MHSYPSSVVFASAPSSLAVSIGDACSTDHDRLDARTGKFSSDCDSTAFCSGSTNATCQPRACRRDEFLFGFGNATAMPPLCKAGTYCPDEGSGCTALVAVGQPCQVDRDEQCAPPPNWQEVASNWNNNGSICLKSACMYANMTLGQPCVLDVATYVYGSNNNTIARHNCQTPQFYCHSGFEVCVPTKAVSIPCDSNEECQSTTCGPRGVCVDPPGTPAHVQAWQLVVTGMSVIAAMVAVVVMLTLFHKRQRLKRYREIREYYDEQVELRRSLAALHAAAADRCDEKDLYD
ncbi:hypothetical protein L226DRAFT_465648 [Lentinus tigrinus ALCF2SS1-7]|uniref:Uncharacterized protein n=1 Tax=Lentinus tigrinus ALCF2SS1-6 TaxID=1328759 RepID=A0A5C2S5T5_9APHY|nr:hypothetical protein L227DRAFT_173016 [Lentinus tigrinus ALCF2SS1-6]RPD73254.1 hypothetical protein L226DRAFT_465648 [Lentinus tigrinus ALCF2SS1-7]